LNFIVVVLRARHWSFLKKRMRLRWLVTAYFMPFLLRFSYFSCQHGMNAVVYTLGVKFGRSGAIAAHFVMKFVEG
jgi:hypothetical protein